MPEELSIVKKEVEELARKLATLESEQHAKDDKQKQSLLPHLPSWFLASCLLLIVVLIGYLAVTGKTIDWKNRIGFVDSEAKFRFGTVTYDNKGFVTGGSEDWTVTKIGKGRFVITFGNNGMLSTPTIISTPMGEGDFSISTISISKEKATVLLLDTATDKPIDTGFTFLAVCE